MPRSFERRIAPFVAAELAQAADLERGGDPEGAFEHLEAAHVLGQRSTGLHVRAHLEMLRWGLRQGDLREVLGQLLRIVGAATKTALGLLPEGNTGGSRVSAFRPLPLREDHARLLAWARNTPPSD